MSSYTYEGLYHAMGELCNRDSPRVPMPVFAYCDVAQMLFIPNLKYF